MILIMINSRENINWYGTYTLTLREIKRFLRVYNQTVIAPAVSALIFLSVFVLAIGHNAKEINGIRFIDFMGYGLIIMSIVQNAFSNSSSSLIMSKVIGYISDILVPPLGGIELVTAFILGAVARGIIVGLFVTIALSPFVNFNAHHPWLLVFFTLFSCLFLGLLGILTGIMSNSFDQNAAITSYIITPLSFLSGTFYSVERLPQLLQTINHCNPFFYMIDGFRYSLTNHADSNIQVGISILIICNLTLFFIVTKLLNIGWKIKD